MGSHSSVVDISATSVQRWAQPTLPLPPLDNLAACIQGPLAEDDNIPLSENFMRQLTLVQVNPRAMCNMDDVKQLFRLSEDEQVDILLTTIKSSLMFSPPDNDLLGVGQCFAWHVTRPVVDVSISSSGMVF